MYGDVQVNGNGDWNVPLFLKDNAPERIKAAKEERDKLVVRVRELNLEIAVLETHIQIGADLDMTRETKQDVAQRGGVPTS